MKTDLFINNEWRPGTSGKRFPVQDPPTHANPAHVAARGAVRERRAYDEVERRSRRYLQMRPDDEGAWNNLGEVLRTTGRLEEFDRLNDLVRYSVRSFSSRNHDCCGASPHVVDRRAKSNRQRTQQP